jgi:hypothetical protein
VVATLVDSSFFYPVSHYFLSVGGEDTIAIAFCVLPIHSCKFLLFTFAAYVLHVSIALVHCYDFIGWLSISLEFSFSYPYVEASMVYGINAFNYYLRLLPSDFLRVSSFSSGTPLLLSLIYIPPSVITRLRSGLHPI